MSFLKRLFGAHLNRRSELGLAQLHRECGIGGSDAGARKLVERGASVGVTVTGPTPLHFAAENDRAEIAEFLISKGANANAKSTDIYGATPLALAIGSRSKQLWTKS